MFRIPLLLAGAAVLVLGCATTETASLGHALSRGPTPIDVESIESEAGPAGLEEEPVVARQALVAMHEFNPWSTVIGAEIPSFILYDDGLVIYLDEHDGGADIREAQLSPQAAERMARTVYDQLEHASPSARLTNTTDQPTVRVMALRDGAWRVSHVYGLGPDGKPTGGPGFQTDAPLPSFVEAYLDLRTFVSADAQAWQPERLEVMMGAFDNPQDIVAWPSRLPKPPAGLAPTKDFRVRKFEIPARFGKQLQGLIASLGPRGAVAWNEHTWSVRARPVIPGEQELRRAARAVL